LKAGQCAVLYMYMYALGYRLPLCFYDISKVKTTDLLQVTDVR
jgi:hypothetical protein